MLPSITFDKANSPRAVANYFIEKSIESGNSVSPLQLIKLVYIAHGWTLALYKRPLINETVEVWSVWTSDCFLI